MNTKYILLHSFDNYEIREVQEEDIRMELEKAAKEIAPGMTSRKWDRIMEVNISIQ
jgi:hypothetical protein